MVLVVKGNKKVPIKRTFLSREDQIRTGDPLHPIQVRYRAAPLPEWRAKLQKNSLISSI